MHAPTGARSLALLLTITLSGPPLAADEWNGLRSSVAPVGDLDGDGVPDFALAHRGTGPAGFGSVETPQPDRVLVQIISGKDGARIRTLEAPVNCSYFGRAMADVGDVDGDGARDLAIAGGAHVWVIAGTDGHVIHELRMENDSRGFGQSLAGGRDVDGDGVPDIAVLRPSQAADMTTLVLIYSGRSGALVRAFGCHATAQRPKLSDELYARVPGKALMGAIALVPDRTGDLAHPEAHLTFEVLDERHQPALRSQSEIVANLVSVVAP